MEKYDPIARFEKYLVNRGYLSGQELKEIYNEWSTKIEEIVRKCISKPPLAVEVIFEDVYSQRFWNLEEQLEEYRESVEVMKKLGIEVE